MLALVGAVAYVAPTTLVKTHDSSILNFPQFEGASHNRTNLFAQNRKTSKTIEVRLSNSLQWLEQFYKTGLNAESARDVYPLVEGIRGLFSSGKLNEINRMLGELDVSKLSCTALVTMLATVFPAKSELSEWDYAVHVVSSKLVSSGYSPEEVLYGLV